MKFKPLTAEQLERKGYKGYSYDKRRQRRQHRQAAKQLSGHGGGITASVVDWHLSQARYLGR